MRLRKLVILVVLQMFIVAFVSCESGSKRNASAKTTNQQVEPTTEERLATIKSDLKMVKAEMAKDGSYDCCIQPGCDWCVLHEGECACHDNVTAGKEVCPGCGLGWHNGKGVVQGVDAKKVKWNITHEHSHEGEHGEDDHDNEDEQHEDEHRH